MPVQHLAVNIPSTCMMLRIISGGNVGDQVVHMFPINSFLRLWIIRRIDHVWQGHDDHHRTIGRRGSGASRHPDWGDDRSMVTYPITLDTLGALVDRGYGIYAHCQANGCGRSVALDLPALAERLGRDHSALAAGLVPKLRCSSCGGREITITISPPQKPIWS